MDSLNFKRTPLAAAVSLALGAGGVQVATAQPRDESAEVMEEIVSYGIRQSLKRSMDFKRNRDGIVDAITAQDIGDFPDSNLAESLQRITGVSIDRERGEGSSVTVRGFGPDFNLVTLNGRQMPTHNGVGRSFSFADIASENIAAVEVYKTGQADVPSGGVGSTINIRTTRPLDTPGRVAAISATGVADESTREGKDFTPQVSGLFAGTFMDDRLGIAFSASYQERDSGLVEGRVNGWRTFTGDAEGWGPIPNNAVQINRPGATDLYSVPQGTGYYFNEYEQTRVNSQLTVQYQASDNIQLTFDHTLAVLEVAHESHDYSAWFGFGGQESVWTDGPLASATQYRENHNLKSNDANNYNEAAGFPDHADFVMDHGCLRCNPASRAFPAYEDFAMGRGIDGRKNELASTGLNLLWDVTDTLQLEFDYHASKAETGADSPYGTGTVLATSSFTRQHTTVHLDAGNAPVMQQEHNRPLHPDDMIVSGGFFNNDISEMDVSQLTVSGTYEFDAGFVESIDFGLQLTELEHESASSVVQRDAWGGATPRGWISHLAQPASLGGALDEFSSLSDPRTLRNYYRFDFEALRARTAEWFAMNEADRTLAASADRGPCGNSLCASTDWSTLRRTDEETLALYAQAKGEFDIGRTVEWRFGLRYEQTDVASEALSPIYDGIVWSAGNEANLQPARDAAGNPRSEFVSNEGDYSYLLPNLDFKLHINDDMVGRLSYSKTLSRPNFDQIQGGQIVNTLLRIDGGTGSRGDPNLEPYDSDNLDLSFEWYYGEDSYVSAGWFRKDVVNFIGNTAVEETTFNVPHPGTGAFSVAARESLIAEGIPSPTPQQIHERVLRDNADDPAVDPVARTVAGKPEDPAAVFEYQVPINIEEAAVDGFELAVQHNFWDSGFGVIFNATFVDADVGYNDLSLDDQFVINGLSDTTNLIAFYEKHGVGVRLTYNWRDAFLQGKGQNTVGGTGPTYVDEYTQWDLNASYTFLDESMSVSLDIINLTNETRYLYGRTRLQTLNAQQLGTRYQLRYTYKLNQ